MPTVTVLIVNHNAGRYLARCLEALAAQEYRDFEVVVVDNASTDGSIESLGTTAANVKIVKTGRNLGFAGGNNYGFEHAVVNEWVALLNPDAFADPRWLSTLMAAAQRHPDCIFFGSRLVLDADRSLLDGVGDVYHVSGLVWRAGHLCPAAGAFAEETEIFSPCAAAALYRADALREAGGFDEDFFCYIEDVDLGFRLRLGGGRGLYVPESVVFHVGSGVTGIRSDFSVYHGHRNMVWTYVKNMPGMLFWAYLPYHLAMNVGSVALLALRGQGRVAMRAKIDALRGLRRMLAKRREIQKRRRVAAKQILAQMARGLPLRR